MTCCNICDVRRDTVTHLHSKMDIQTSSQGTDENFKDRDDDEFLHKHYWKLQHLREDIIDTEDQDPVKCQNQPVTCFLYPELTPSKLRDHLIAKGASDACIVEWMRKLQEIRKHPHDVEREQSSSYGVELLGKN